MATETWKRIFFCLIDENLIQNPQSGERILNKIANALDKIFLGSKCMLQGFLVSLQAKVGWNLPEGILSFYSQIFHPSQSKHGLK